ncbi:MAG: M23 family metallopeptidase [Patescibacteria group bacterium]
MRRGFSIIFVFIATTLVGLVLVALFVSPKKRVNDNLTRQSQGEEPPVFIQNIGIDFEDFEFTKNPLAFDMLFIDYGFFIPKNDMGPAKLNPQPTFILPLGTKVHALIDGVVVDTPKLYSGDYSVIVAPDKSSNWAYETEHVINVQVKLGDRVRAGQVVAEVSDYDTHNYGGLGLVEIGILKGGSPPKHLCPFKYLDPSIKQDIENKILEFYKSWEEFKGDENIYDESAYASPGCLTYDEIEG